MSIHEIYFIAFGAFCSGVLSGMAFCLYLLDQEIKKQ